MLRHCAAQASVTLAQSFTWHKKSVLNFENRMSFPTKLPKYQGHIRIRQDCSREGSDLLQTVALLPRVSLLIEMQETTIRELTYRASVASRAWIKNGARITWNIREIQVQEGHLKLVELILGQLGGLELRVEEPAGGKRCLLRLRLVASIRGRSNRAAPSLLHCVLACGFHGGETVRWVGLGWIVAGSNNGPTT